MQVTTEFKPRGCTGGRARHPHEGSVNIELEVIDEVFEQDP